MIQDIPPADLDTVMRFSLTYHQYDQVFWIYRHITSVTPLGRKEVINWMQVHPSLAFVLLKQFPPSEETCELSPETQSIGTYILQNIIRSANELGIACLAALERLSITIASLPFNIYAELLWLAAISIRSSQVLQETLLVLSDSRASRANLSASARYAHKFALGIAFERAEEAADECPCNDEGRPRRQRTPPAQTRLKPAPAEDSDETNQVIATMRIDARSPIRIHSHVRLQVASKEEGGEVKPPVLDGIVVMSMKGELKIELMHPLPPEAERLEWNIYNAGSIGESHRSHNDFIGSSLLLCFQRHPVPCWMPSSVWS